MRNIFKATLAGLAFALVATAALANWNIVQFDDGSTGWQRSENGQITKVGRIFLTATLSSVATTATSTAQTAQLTSPVTGNITAVFIQIDRGITQAVSFIVQALTSSNTMAGIGSAITPATGQAQSYAVTTNTPSGNTSVGFGRAIVIGATSVAAGTGTANAVVTIQIDQ